MQQLLETITNSDFFGIVLCVVAYEIGMLIHVKSKRLALLNPMLIAIAITIGVLVLTGAEYETFSKSANLLTVLLTPTCVAFAVPLYRQLDTLKKNAPVIIAGIFVGSIASCTSVFLMCKLFGLSKELCFALLPKSVTTPIAAGIAGELGGITSVTILAVIFTGILGAAFVPPLCRILHLTDRVAIGLGTGTSSHALGTSTALTMGEVEGAMSSLSIVVAGILTVVIAPIFAMFY